MTGKISKQRSPNFPQCTLEEAVQKVGLVYSAAKRSTLSMATVAQAMEYKALHGKSRSMVAALVAYGLLDRTKKEYAVSDMAMKILYSTSDEQKKKALREAALLPKEFNKIYEKYHDCEKRILIAHLMQGDFTPDGAENASAIYKENAKFVGLDSGVNLPFTGEEEEEFSEVADKDGEKPIETGVYVQWSSQGVDQFPIPRKVVGLSDDGQWAFIEGTKTGLPISQLAVTDTPEKGNKPPLNPYSSSVLLVDKNNHLEVEEDRFTLDEGPVVIQWPKNLSSESVNDLEYWIKGLLRRAHRKAGSQPSSE